MPLPKMKKNISMLKFCNANMEDLVISDDETVLTQCPEAELNVNTEKEELQNEEEVPLNQEGIRKMDENHTEEEVVRDNQEKKVPESFMKWKAAKKQSAMKAAKKRQMNLEDSPLKKKMKRLSVEDLLKDQEPDQNGMGTMLSIIMIVWYDGILIHLLQTLNAMNLLALKEKMITAKKILYMMRQGITHLLKKLRMEGIELEQYSIEDFVVQLQEIESFTMFTKRWILQEDSDWIITKFIETLQVPYSSSSIIPTTTTSYTTAHIPTVVADVNLPTTSKKTETASADDILDELFHHSNTTSNIGCIQQSIARREGDVVVILKSPGECGYRVIKLDVYDFGKISGVPKEQWWKHAKYRSTFLTSSPVDYKETLVAKLLSVAAQDLKKIPKVEKEEKVMKSYGFYKNDRHHQ